MLRKLLNPLAYAACLFLIFSDSDLKAQSTTSGEKYGKTLNLGVGVGYYRYVGRSLPVLHADFEFDVARNFTLAPSISFYTYNSDYYWGNNDYPYRYYRYSETVVPICLKGTYYFDQLFKANAKWDFYAAASLGVAIVRSNWEDGYYGERNRYRNSYRRASPVFADIHVGAEYHVNKTIGLYLDLTPGVSTFGLGIHF